MIGSRHLAVVVPAFDEAMLIAGTLASIPAEVDRIIVVDDASTDATATIVAACADPRIRLIQHARNGGVGAAIITGYRTFLEETECGREDAIAVVMAGDAQMDPADFLPLLDPIVRSDAGYAKGNRLLTHDVATVMPRTRFLGNIVFTLLTKFASGYWHVMDSQCGYAAITRESLLRIDLDGIYPRYGFPNDLLVHLNVARVRVADVPVRAVYGKESSGINPWIVIPRITLLLIRRFFWRLWAKHVLRDFHPLVLLYAFGLLLSAAGALLSVWLLVARSFLGHSLTGATAVFAALLVLAGLQGFLFGVVLDVLENQALRASPASPREPRER